MSGILKKSRSAMEVEFMVDFIMCIIQYIVLAILIMAFGGVGAFIGIKMRKASDAKKAAAATEE